jgi:hypothetical protein
MAGIVQLEVTDFFRELFDEYGDVAKYPYGPPSHVTRQIIQNPDTPIRNETARLLFYRRKSGVWLLVLGSLLQIGGTWA